ncbi:MAG: tandem-95 repeat protein [Nitrospira sp.]
MFGRKKRQAPQQQHKAKMEPPASGASRVKASLLSLEQRLMFDAAAAATAAEVNQEQVAQEQAEAAVSSEGSSGEPTAAETESQDLLQAIASYNPGESRTEVVFVDPTVPNYGELLSGMDPNIEVIMLDGGQDGVEQIAAALSGRSGIDAVHLISHGDAGTLQLGTGTLTQESMTSQYADELATIKQTLSEQADILVYGCEFAEGQAGQDAATLLSQLTGADVAASTDATGHAEFGGDWVLETQTGAIEATLAVTDDVQANWKGLLAETWMNASTGAVIAGPAGNDWYVGDSANNTPTAAGGGADIMYGAGGDDSMQGGSGNDILVGGTGNDTIYGNSDDDVILGGTGNDYLDGGSAVGKNTIIGGGGNDQMVGGSGTDVFRFTGAQYGDAYTVDGGGATDIIDLSEFSTATITNSGGVITVDRGGGDVFTITHSNVETIITAATVGNHGPLADAGTDQTVSTSATVTLTAAGSSDRDGNSLTYQWTQIEGPKVTLSSSTAASPTFTAPSSSATLQFVVVVSDGTTSHADTVTISVTSNSAPTITSNSGGATAGISVAENTTSVTTVTATDANAGQTLSYSISGGADAAKFSINSSTGALSFASAPNYESPTDSGGNNVYDVTVQVSDGQGGVDSQALSVTVTDLANETPTDLSSGIELNADGGNDAYLISDTGLSQSLTATTLEIRFAANDTPYEPVFISFNNPAGDEISIQIDEPAKDLELDFGAGNVALASAIDYRAALVDGAVHTLSVTWDNAAGNWSVYIDGAHIESGTGLSVGTPLDATNGRFVFGQEQDAQNGGYDSSQYFSGTFYDVRIWNDVRTAGEIAQYHQQQLDLTPAEAAAVGLVANWQMDGFDGSNQVVEIVSGNNLSIAHASGAGFTTGVVTSQLSLEENSANGSHVGFVTAEDTDASETFSYTLTDSAGGRFAVNSSTGEITVANGALLDYDTAASHNIVVRVTDSGGLTYDEVFTINLTNVNETPTDLSLSANVVVENVANGTVVGTVSGTDPDSGDTKTYSFTDSAGGRFAINSSTGEITVANSSLLNYEQATSHTVTVRVTDSGGLTYDETFTINVTNVNEAPTGADATITINEDVPHVFTTANFGFSDVDAGDSLSAVRIDTIPTAGTLTLSGSAVTAGQVITVADITGGNLVFTPAADATGTGYASLTFSVRDSNNAYDAAPNTLTVDVTVVNDAPVVTVDPSDVNFTEQSPVGIDVNLTISDVDSGTMTGATVRISANYESGADELAFTDQNGITGTWNSTNGTLTLSGTASVADYQTALRSITFYNGSDTPSPLTRTVEWIVTDGSDPSAAVYRDITVTAQNDAPVLDLDADNSSGATGADYQVTFTENGGAVSIVDAADALLIDVDGGNLMGLTVTLSNPLDGASEVLTANTSGTSIVAVYNSGTGVLTLSGSDSIANYQQVLRTIQYSNSSEAPNLTSRVLYVVSEDGPEYSNTATVTVSMVGVNDAPVNTVPGAQAATEDTALVLSGVSVNDVDGNLSTVQLGVLNGTVSVTLQGGATISAGASGTNTLTLSGSQADINATLATLVYQGTLNYYGADTLTVTSTDTNSVSDVDTVAITVTAQNDAPVVTAVGPTVTFVEGGSPQVIGPLMTVTDVDSTNLDTGVLTIALTQNGTADDRLQVGNFGTGPGQVGTSGSSVTYEGVVIGTVSGGTNGSDPLVITFNANATVAAVQEVVTSIQFHNVGESPSTATRQVTFELTDGDGGIATPATKLVNVQATNDAPTDLTLSANTVTENAANGTVVGTVTGTDVDAGDTKSYSFTDSAGGRFVINSSTGEITVADGTLLNYEQATSHTVTVRVTDSGGLTYDETFTINVTDVNEAPTGADATVTIGEDTAHTFTTANFGFSDVDAGDSLSAVRIDTIPTAGTLTLSGSAVTAGQVITVADITAGNLVFTPAADATGTGYASLTFSVRDSNNAYDAAPNTLTVDVTAVNDAPIRTAGTVSNLTVSEDAGLTSLGLGGVIYSPGGGADESGQALTYTVTAIPAPSVGQVVLADGTTPVSIGSYTLAEIQAMQFKPAANASGVTAFQFNVYDSGGTANGGANTISQFILITVTAVNDAPTITDLSGDSLAYSEGDGAVVIEQGGNALVADVDSTNFDTGTLTVSFTAGSDSAEDVLSIRNQGTGAGQIGVSGSNITYGGTVIGTYAGGSGGSTLVITFNGNATPAAVTALTQHITYENTDTGAPTTGARTVRYTLTDGDGGTSANYDTTVLVSGTSDVPVNTVPGAQTVTEDTPLAISGISVSDADGNLSTVQLAVGNGTLNVTLSGSAGISSGSNGTNTLTLSGSQADINATLATLVYQGMLNYNGADTLTVTSTDTNSGTDVDTVAITVNAVNDAPTDLALSANTVTENAANGTVVGTVTGTDVDAGDTKSYSFTDSAGGRFAINSSTGEITVADGTLLNYEQATSHTVTVRMTDSGGLTYDETFTINLTNVNETPTGADATISIDEDIPHVFTAANFGFSDVDAGDSLSAVRIDTIPTAGTVTLSGSAVTAGQVITVADITAGNLVFTPVADATGTGYASLTFSVRDSNNAYDAAPNTLTVDVTAVNDAPVNTVPGAQSVNEDTALGLSGISVTDVDGNLSTVQLGVLNGTVSVTLQGTATISAGSNGTNTLTLSGSQADINATLATLVYQGTLNYNGADTLTVTSTDTNSGTDVDTVAITVTAVDDPTLVTAGTSGTGNEDTPITGTLTATDVEGLSDGTVFTVSTNATNGTASIDPATGLWSYSPNADYHGADSFTVTITDDAGNSSTQVISVTVSPVVDITNDSLTTSEDSAISANVLTGTNGATADSFEGTPVLTSVTQGANGTVTFLANGTVTYTPNANFNGTDSFTYTITSGGVTETATVTVTVNAVNDPTVVTGGTSGSGAEDTTITNTLTATDAEGLSDGSVFTVTTAATNGTTSIDPATGLWSYTPMADWHGSDSFTVTITDDAGHTATQVISVTVTPVNDAPVLHVNTGSTALEGGTDSITASELVVTDVDTSAAQLTYSIGTGPAYGRLELTTAPGIAVTSFTQADIDLNRLVYVHDGSETTSDNFTFTVSDGAGGGLGLTTVTLTITPVNDTPGIVSGGGGATASLNVAENVCAITIVIGEDVDLPGQALTYSVSGGADQALFAIDATTGNLCFTAPKDFEVATDADGDNVYVVQVQVTDSQGATVTQTIQVTVTDVAEALASSSKTLVVPSVLLPTSVQELGKRSVSVATERTEPPSTILQSPATEQPLKAAEAVGLPGGGMIPLAQPPVDRPAAVVKVEDLRRYEPAPTGSGMPRWNDPSDPQSFTILPVEPEQPIAPKPSEEQASLSDILIAKLDAMTESLEDAIGVEEEQEKIVARVAALSGTTLSVGFVAWAVRSSALLASCLTTLPAWKSFDPLPVVRLTKHERDRRRQETDVIQRQEQKEFGGLEKFF